MKFSKTAACGVGLLALPMLTAAQEAPAALEEIDTVTIIGHKVDPADVPGSAYVLDAEELETYVNGDILRVLRAVPGVYIQEEEGYGLRPNIGIRGSGIDRSARIALLEDGVLIAPAPYAASSAYYFPTQRRMNSVEVLKGPAAVAVGPRTTGGAMNLISTPIPDQLGFNADIRGGEFSTLDTHVNVGNRGERFSWLVETVQAQTDGFKTIDGPVGGDTGFEIQDYIAKLQFDSDPTSRVYQSLRLKFGYTDQVSNDTYLGLTDADFDTDPYQRYAASADDQFVSDHQQYVATYVIDTEDNWRGEVTAYRNNFARNWYKLQSVDGEGLDTVLTDPLSYATELGYLKGVTSPDDALQIRANNRSYYAQGVQAKVTWNFGNADNGVALNTGFRVHQDEEDRFQHQDGYRMEDGVLILTSAGAPGSQTNRVSDADVLSLFVDAEVNAGDWTFTPGLRFEDIRMTRYDYGTDDPTRANGPIRTRKTSADVYIPGLGALYRINENWRVLAGINEGYNPPSPGSTAGAESSLNLEAGTRYTGGNLSFEALYFLNDYDNLVGTVTDSTGGGGQIGDQFDGGAVEVSGIEMSLGHRFDTRLFAIPVGLQYTWTAEAEFKSGFESDFEPWGVVEPGDELPYIPEQQLRASVGVEKERFRVNVAASYVGKVRTTAGQGAYIPGETIDSRVVWDMVAAFDFTEHLSTYLKIDNLTDEVYIAARRPSGVRPGLPQAAYLGFTYRL